MKYRVLLFLIASPFSLLALSSEQAYLQLAQTLKAEGNLPEAIAQYKNTLLKNPHNKEALLDLALIFHSQNDVAQAAEYFSLLSQQDSHNFEAAYNAGTCYNSLGNLEKAIASFQKAIAINPSEIKGQFNIGLAYKKNGNHAQAISAFEKVLQLSPDHFDAAHNLATTYRDLHNVDAAIKAFDKALELQQNNFQLKFEKANMLTQFGNAPDGIKIYSELLAAAPNNLTIISNIAFALKKQGDYAHAIEYYKKVIEQQPANLKAHMGIAYAYLTMGDFENGFKSLAISNSSDTSPRLLKSTEQLNGKIILIPIQWCLEDLMQIIRYAKLLKDSGATVHAQTNIAMIPLLKCCTSIDAIIPEGQNIGQFDHYIPLTSLPALFAASKQNIPREVPYLTLPEDLKEFWHTKLRNNNTIRVGIYFSENENTPIVAENKNIPLKTFAPFAQLQDVSLYSLQAIPPEQLHDLPNDLLLTIFGAGFNHSASSLLHIAAVIQNLDLVITRDSIIAHIAGALGRPVFVALPYHADWRWMLERRDSPWYPSMRLFRQKTPGNWDTVIEDMITTFTTKGITKRVERTILF